MQDSIAMAPGLGRHVAAVSQAAPRRGRERLWEVLACRWLGGLDRKIEADLRWLDHAGVLADCND